MASIYLLQLVLKDGRHLSFRAFEKIHDADNMLRAINDFYLFQPSIENEEATSAWRRRHPCPMVYCQEIDRAYVESITCVEGEKV